MFCESDIFKNHEVLYESDYVLLVNNRSPEPLADYWDYDVVVWDRNILVALGAGNCNPDGSYTGFYTYGPYAPEVESDNAADFAENVLVSCYMADDPDGDSLRKIFHEFVGAKVSPELKDAFDYYVEWFCGGFFTDAGKEVPFDGVGVLLKGYLPSVSEAEPLMLHFNVAYWCEQHFMPGGEGDGGNAEAPLVLETLKTINLAESTRQDFAYVESEWAVYDLIARHWVKVGRFDELLALVSDAELRKEVQQARGELDGGFEGVIKNLFV